METKDVLHVMFIKRIDACVYPDNIMFGQDLARGGIFALSRSVHETGRGDTLFHEQMEEN